MICSKKCRFCRLDMESKGVGVWKCVINEYYAPLDDICNFSDYTIKELSGIEDEI